MPSLSIRDGGFIRRLGPYLDLVVGLGEAYQELPPKPGVLHWLTLAAKVGSAYNEFTGKRLEAVHQSPSDWATDYFEAEGWTALAPHIWPTMMATLTGSAVVTGYWHGDDQSYVLAEGRVGGWAVRWVQDGLHSRQCVYGPFVRTADVEAVMAHLSTSIWRQTGSRHIRTADQAVLVDESFGGEWTATAEIDLLDRRFRPFYDRGIVRSVLLVGLPGSGKSTAIRALVSRLGARSLRIQPSDLVTRPSRTEISGPALLTNVVQMTRPDVLILDDLDRIKVTADVLTFLEAVRLHCRLVVGSCNSDRRLMGAALRPGRFDDVQEFTTNDGPLIAHLSGGDPSATARLGRLPVAYARCYHDMATVHGPEAARGLLDELEQRSAAIEKATAAAEPDEDDED
jgi:hypothetical protein